MPPKSRDGVAIRPLTCENGATNAGTAELYTGSVHNYYAPMSTNDRLRAAAHPLRARLLRELDGGPATATELATRLGTNTGATSYHLRRLEAAGLVEDTGAATGRRRAWARTTEPLVGVEDVQDPDSTASLDWLERDYLAYLTDKANAWLDDADRWPRPWRDAAGQRDYLVQVTDEQLAALNAEIAAVVARYRTVGSGNPQAKRVSVYQVNLPLDAPPRRTPA